MILLKDHEKIPAPLPHLYLSSKSHYMIYQVALYTIITKFSKISTQSYLVVYSTNKFMHSPLN